MGKFARKVSRHRRCHKGGTRYLTKRDVTKAQKRMYEMSGVKKDGVFCYLCGAFHLEIARGE